MIKAKKSTTTNTMTTAAPNRGMFTPEKYRSSGGFGDYYERPTNRWDPETTIAPTRGKVTYPICKSHIQFAPTKHGGKNGNDYSETSSEWKGEKGILLDIICFVSH